MLLNTKHNRTWKLGTRIADAGRIRMPDQHGGGWPSAVTPELAETDSAPDLCQTDAYL